MSTARRYRYLVQSHGPILAGGGGGGLGGSGDRLLRVLVEAQLLGKVFGQPFYSDRIFGGLSVNGEKKTHFQILNQIKKTNHKQGYYTWTLRDSGA